MSNDWVDVEGLFFLNLRLSTFVGSVTCNHVLCLCLPTFTFGCKISLCLFIYVCLSPSFHLPFLVHILFSRLLFCCALLTLLLLQPFCYHTTSSSKHHGRFFSFAWMRYDVALSSRFLHCVSVTSIRMLELSLCDTTRHPCSLLLEQS